MPSGKVVYMDFDDLSLSNKGLDYLLLIKEHFPNFKCTCFTVPLDSSMFIGRDRIKKLKEWAEIIKKLDWIEVAVHGLTHMKGDCLLDHKHAKKSIHTSEKIFKGLKIPFVKIYKAPFWEMSKEFEEVLNKKGYVKAIDRNNPISFTDIPTYTYSWSLDEPIPDYKTLKGHGHMYGTNNGLEKVFENILRLPEDTEFKFVSEYPDVIRAQHKSSTNI